MCPAGIHITVELYMLPGKVVACNYARVVAHTYYPRELSLVHAVQDEIISKAIKVL